MEFRPRSRRFHYGHPGGLPNFTHSLTRSRTREKLRARPQLFYNPAEVRLLDAASLDPSVVQNLCTAPPQTRDSRVVRCRQAAEDSQMAWCTPYPRAVTVT